MRSSSSQHFISIQLERGNEKERGREGELTLSHKLGLEKAECVKDRGRVGDGKGRGERESWLARGARGAKV
jgi:hypothetical protein